MVETTPLDGDGISGFTVLPGSASPPRVEAQIDNPVDGADVNGPPSTPGIPPKPDATSQDPNSLAAGRQPRSAWDWYLEQANGVDEDLVRAWNADLDNLFLVVRPSLTVPFRALATLNSPRVLR